MNHIRDMLEKQGKEMYKMKKILMVCESFGGGVFTYVSQLCNDMADNFDIYLAYSLRPQTPKNFKKVIDSRVHLIEVKNFNSNVTNIWNDFKIIKELRKVENEVKPDIIHLHSSVAGGIGRVAFNGKKNKILYTPHGYAFVLMKPSIKTVLYKFMEKVLGKTSKAITLTCCQSEDEVASKLTKRHTYIESGVNLVSLSNALSNVKPVKSKKEFIVFSLGRITGQKQPELFNKIAELVPNTKFLWIGGGEDEKYLTSSNISVTGWKNRNEALSLAKSADVYILCSRGEAIAESLIENMYMKKLVLVSNVMGNKSVVKNGINGYICNSPQEYAKRIKEAEENFPKKLTENAYSDVLHIYNTDIMKKKYIKFYSGL